MSQLGKRLISSAFLVSIAVGTMFAAPLWLFVLVAEVIVLTAFYEFLGLANQKGIQINRVYALVIGSCIPVAFAYGVASGMLVFAFVALFLYHFFMREIDRALVTASVTTFGLIYIVWFFSHVIGIRQQEQGAWWTFYTVLMVKGGDAGAYFVGTRFGKRKLIEAISPNKSVEGAIGGWVTTVILSVLSGVFLRGVPFLHLIGLGALIGVVSQLGDLAESLLKRDAGVKDSGQIPGLGGVLDVLDSLFLTIPLVYYYIRAAAL